VPHPQPLNLVVLFPSSEIFNQFSLKEVSFLDLAFHVTVPLMSTGGAFRLHLSEFSVTGVPEDHGELSVVIQLY
jgi:hypothetical protein